MPGKSLSRWTLAWFATALICLSAGLLALACGYGGPGMWQSGQGLAVLHLLALGWLSTAMIGALVQFVPVLSAQELRNPALALPALVMVTAGTVTLVAGFWSLDASQPVPVLLCLGPALLGLGLFMAGAMLVPTLMVAQGWRQTGNRPLLAGMAALALVWVSGLGMAACLAGADINVALIPDAIPFHALLAVGGWLSLSAFGTSYKLFAMFLMAPETGGILRRAGLWAAVTSLCLTILALALMLDGQSLPAALPAMPAILTATLYLADMRRVWAKRRRPVPEVNMQITLAALVCLGLSALLCLMALRFGGAWGEAAVFVALAGWLSTLTLAQMFKIVSFLTWIQVFAPRIGRSPVPLLHELGNATAARRWLMIWLAGTALATLALIAGNTLPFRLGAALMLLAVAGLVRELFAIRRLRHVSLTQRPADLPPLILPVHMPQTGA